MKILLVTILLGFSGAIAAQKLKPSQVPDAAKAAFTKANPNTAGQWEKEDGNYEVNFTKDGMKMSCVISKAGSIMETESEINVSELPEKVKAYVRQHNKKGNAEKAEKIVKANGETSYEVAVKGKEWMFDNNGNMVKQESKDKEDRK